MKGRSMNKQREQRWVGPERVNACNPSLELSVKQRGNKQQTTNNWASVSRPGQIIKTIVQNWAKATTRTAELVDTQPEEPRASTPPPRLKGRPSGIRGRPGGRGQRSKMAALPSPASLRARPSPVQSRLSPQHTETCLLRVADGSLEITELWSRFKEALRLHGNRWRETDPGWLLAPGVSCSQRLSLGRR